MNNNLFQTTDTMLKECLSIIHPTSNNANHDRVANLSEKEKQAAERMIRRMLEFFEAADIMWNKFSNKEVNEAIDYIFNDEDI